jgi:UDP-3-O-[3-hydroxymyristoyl] glucosamine N-acyltransferase
MTTYTIQDIARLTGGTYSSKGDMIIKKISPIQEAESESLSFLYNARYFQFLSKTKASAVLVPKNFIHEEGAEYPVLIYVDDVYSSYTMLLEIFNHKKEEKNGIEEPVFINSEVTLGKDVYLGAFAYIGKHVIIGDNVKIYPNTYIGDHVNIGDNTIIYPGVKIYPDCEIGKNCIFHSGCVIGTDGFGFAPQADGTYNKIPQIGHVIIEDNVEIGANTTIDRATMEATIIRKGVKLDNLNMIAHNVEMGENTVMAAQSGISGSTKIGKNCVIAGQVGFVGHIEIADGSHFGAKSGIAKSIKEANKKWFGVPLMPYQETLRLHSILKKLPSMYKDLFSSK